MIVDITVNDFVGVSWGLFCRMGGKATDQRPPLLGAARVNLDHRTKAPFSRFILGRACAARKCAHRVHGNSCGVAACGNCLFHIACTEKIPHTTPCSSCHIPIGPLDTHVFNTCLRDRCTKKASGLCKECCKGAVSVVETQGNPKFPAPRRSPATNP